jgi:hypothetical protein
MSDWFKVEFKKNKEMFQAVIQALTFVAWSYIIICNRKQTRTCGEGNRFSGLDNLKKQKQALTNRFKHLRNLKRWLTLDQLFELTTITFDNDNCISTFENVNKT